MGLQEAHHSLDTLLKDGRISGDVYLALRDSLGECTTRSAVQPDDVKKTTPLLKGMLVNFIVLSLGLPVVLTLYTVLAIGPQTLDSNLIPYFLLLPVAIALYHVVFLPVGELAYQALKHLTNARRLPVYVAVAWTLVLPMFFLAPPIID